MISLLGTLINSIFSELTAFALLKNSDVSFQCTGLFSKFTFVDICFSITTTNMFCRRRTFWALT